MVILEAMKTEHTVRAPCAGTVSALSCFEGSQIADGSVLAIILPASRAAWQTVAA